jgi:hypothetical protein
MGIARRLLRARSDNAEAQDEDLASYPSLTHLRLSQIDFLLALFRTSLACPVTPLVLMHPVDGNLKKHDSAFYIALPMKPTGLSLPPPTFFFFFFFTALRPNRLKPAIPRFRLLPLALFLFSFPTTLHRQVDGEEEGDDRRVAHSLRAKSNG